MRRFLYLGIVSVCFVSMNFAANVTPLQWLQKQTKPVFKTGHALPVLGQMHCILPPVDVRIELAGNWGYAATLSRAVVETQLIAACNANPAKYKASTQIGNLGNLSQSFPAGSYLKDANGNDVVINGRKTMSTEISDAAFRQTLVNDALNQISRQIPGLTQPIALIDNWTEYMPLPGDIASVGANDAAVLAAKGTQSWSDYVSRRIAHYDSIMRVTVKAAYPSALYIAYTYSGLGAWDWKYMKVTTDLPGPECYYNYYNAGYSLNTGDMLSRRLNALSTEIAEGSPYYYGWLSAGFSRNIATFQGDLTQGEFSDLRRWMGYLKMSYTAGMIGGITTGDFDCGITYGTFDENIPPKWLDQMPVLGHAHALFSWLEPILRNSDLLPGPNNYYEFPTGFAKKKRVVARQLHNAERWLVSAWAMDGVDQDVTVTIPGLGDYTITARDCGTVCLVGKVGSTVTTLWYDQNGMTPSLTASTLDTSQASTNPNIIMLDRPTFSTPGGIYGSAQSITISTITSGAMVRYTVDGTEPTSSSTQYTTPIPVSGMATIKAKTFKTGLLPSFTSAANYRILTSPPANTNFVNGVNYKYYEGNWTTLPNFSTLTPKSTGTCANISLNLVTHRADSFAIEFSGYINLPTDGYYTFSTMSDDGSKLYLADYLMVNNDSIRTTMARKLSTQTWIKAGKYPITVSYFFNGGILNYLLAEWEGPGLPFARIPQEYLYYASGTGVVQPAMQIQPTRTEIHQTALGIVVNVAEKEAHVIELFNGVGKLEKKLRCNTHTSYLIPIKELARGMHIVKIQTDHASISRVVVVF